MPFIQCQFLKFKPNIKYGEKHWHLHGIIFYFFIQYPMKPYFCQGNYVFISQKVDLRISQNCETKSFTFFILFLKKNITMSEF